MDQEIVFRKGAKDLGAHPQQKYLVFGKYPEGCGVVKNPTRPGSADKGLYKALNALIRPLRAL